MTDAAKPALQPVSVLAPTKAPALGRWGWIILGAFAVYAATTMRWDWLLDYYPKLLWGLLATLLLLVVTTALGLAAAIPLGFVQVVGPRWLSVPARTFCSIIRGTPLLLQLWLLYYGLGSVFAANPEIRDSALWPLLRQAWPYAVIALTVSYAAYEGEVFRGAFAGVAKGQLEAAQSFGMSRWHIFRRIWLPQAFNRALPTLVGETILQLKATPLVATITVMDVYSVAAQVRQATYLTYEPLILISVIYVLFALLIQRAFAAFSTTRYMRSPR
ncbi:ABC transporter permease subunit [Paracoccus aerius]|uniref:ABC transporter permease subunit n=1 Tax=Paracoccus aerius TaxID=1915382 RepID=A0ABS1SAU5_9RHOB|nr:ABC transporter permease subunit [Paracoccus aerius]MBL3674827.1 ABC transporter permease subunit [Paracoccus aerius]GHG29415.1 ABC transporter permease [Paracoccus aerius]